MLIHVGGCKLDLKHVSRVELVLMVCGMVMFV